MSQPIKPNEELILEVSVLLQELSASLADQVQRKMTTSEDFASEYVSEVQEYAHKLAALAATATATSATAAAAATTVAKCCSQPIKRQRTEKRKGKKTVVVKLAWFSHRPLMTLGKFFNLPERYEDLNAFELPTTPLNQIVDLSSTAAELRRAVCNAEQDVVDMGEISRYSLISPILAAAADCFDSRITYQAQYRLYGGKYACGYPDWALLADKQPILVVEAKRGAIDLEAVGQTIVQMYASYIKVRPNDEVKCIMYGMVTTAVQSLFLQGCFRDRECSVTWNGKVLEIPHRKTVADDFSADSIALQVQHLHGIVKEQLAQFSELDLLQ